MDLSCPISIPFISKLTRDSLLSQYGISPVVNLSGYCHKYIKKLQAEKRSIGSIKPYGKMSVLAAASPSTAGTQAVEGSELPDSRSVGEKDLLIVGPGVLGRLVAESWQQENPSCRIFGQTRSMDHHEELQKLGIQPSLKGSRTSEQFPFVIFCAPPSGSEDYPTDVREATLQWNGEGAFLFTSSSAVYDCSDNGLCSEVEKALIWLEASSMSWYTKIDLYFARQRFKKCSRDLNLHIKETPTVPIGRSSRTDVLLKAENEVLKVGGSVVRLAGLYKLDRGAHIYCLEKGTVDTRPDHIVNLIHYEDAASLCVCILKRKFRQRIFMGCDNHPLSRKDLMEYVNRSGKFNGKFLGFTGVDGPLGKRMDNTKTRNETGWEPKYPSFVQFLGISE